MGWIWARSKPLASGSYMPWTHFLRSPASWPRNCTFASGWLVQGIRPLDWTLPLKLLPRNFKLLYTQRMNTIEEPAKLIKVSKPPEMHRKARAILSYFSLAWYLFYLRILFWYLISQSHVLAITYNWQILSSFLRFSYVYSNTRNSSRPSATIPIAL